jgi:GNAT superfamily N-acetyltransferase
MKSSSPATQILEADLTRSDHQEAVLDLTSAYALDPMGNGAPLSSDVLMRLIPGLRSHPGTLVLLAYAEGRAVGIATCFRGFSTFHARPLLNVHDLAVLPNSRSLGIGRQLLEAVAQRARDLGCCRVTLEVQTDNRRARQLYESAGFAPPEYGPTSAGALFLSKPL